MKRFSSEIHGIGASDVPGSRFLDESLQGIPLTVAPRYCYKPENLLKLSRDFYAFA